MTEQKAREGELRANQACFEDAGALGAMTSFNRVGCTPSNAHYGMMMNILHKEWGFKGLLSQDFIVDAGLSVLKEMVQCGVTMTVSTGDNDLDEVSAKWDYWTLDNVSKDAVEMQALKDAMTWQAYAIANSNAMDGLNETSEIVNVRTWYDNALTGLQIAFVILTAVMLLMYIRDLKKQKLQQK